MDPRRLVAITDLSGYLLSIRPLGVTAGSLGSQVIGYFKRIYASKKVFVYELIKSRKHRIRHNKIILPCSLIKWFNIYWYTHALDLSLVDMTMRSSLLKPILGHHQLNVSYTSQVLFTLFFLVFLWFDNALLSDCHCNKPEEFACRIHQNRLYENKITERKTKPWS